MSGYPGKLGHYILILEPEYNIILHFLLNLLFMNRLQCNSKIMTLDEKTLDAVIIQLSFLEK